MHILISYTGNTTSSNLIGCTEISCISTDVTHREIYRETYLGFAAVHLRCQHGHVFISQVELIKLWSVEVYSAVTGCGWGWWAGLGLRGWGLLDLWAWLSLWRLGGACRERESRNMRILVLATPTHHSRPMPSAHRLI